MIQADDDGKKLLNALCDATLKLHGDSAFNLVCAVKQELQKTYAAVESPSSPEPERSE